VSVSLLARTVKVPSTTTLIQLYDRCISSSTLVIILKITQLLLAIGSRPDTQRLRHPSCSGADRKHLSRVSMEMCLLNVGSTIGKVECTLDHGWSLLGCINPPLQITTDFLHLLFVSCSHPANVSSMVATGLPVLTARPVAFEPAARSCATREPPFTFMSL